MGGKYHKDKKSVEVTKFYSVSHVGEERDWIGNRMGDPHAAMRAARYIKGRGHGVIVRKPRSWGNTRLLVKLVASPATHRDAVRTVNEREGISVCETKVDGISHRSRTKWTWEVGLHCEVCGTCYAMLTEQAKKREEERGTDLLCHACARLKARNPLAFLAMAV